MDKNAVTIAVPKGRLFEDCMDLFRRMGVPVAEGVDTTRKLVFLSMDGSIRFLVVRDKDVPAYVEYGAADMGIVGKDVLMEAGGDLLEPIDLGFGFCRIVVAEPASGKKENPTGWGQARVATKYPNISAAYFSARGEQVEIIPLYGSIELAPSVGLAERIVDLVSTGETLKQNNLIESDEIMQITAKLVVNRASLKVRSERIEPLIEAIENAAGVRS
ncbi:MAG: ATP phosphoribosyltransferase [bacterium]